MSLPIEKTLEYKLISDFYGSRKANRSGVLLMDHITQGLCLLKQPAFSNNLEMQQAFCLHPLFQDDYKYFQVLDWVDLIKPKVVLLATEYRHVANNYLPKHKSQVPNTSQLNAVNLMLVADKVHNKWQFEKHLQGKIQNSERLDEYFLQWLNALYVTPVEYAFYAKLLDDVESEMNKSRGGH